MTKTFIIIGFLLFLCSCASKHIDPRKHQSSNQVFAPYKQEWILNGGGKTISPEILSKDIVINFSSTIEGIGVCVLRTEIQDREIWVSTAEWNSHPDKRKYITNQLLSACYGLSMFSYGYYHYVLRSY